MSAQRARAESGSDLGIIGLPHVAPFGVRPAIRRWCDAFERVCRAELRLVTGGETAFETDRLLPELQLPGSPRLYEREPEAGSSAVGFLGVDLPSVAFSDLAYDREAET